MALVSDRRNDDVLDFEVDVVLCVGEVEVRGVVHVLMTAPSSPTPTATPTTMLSVC